MSEVDRTVAGPGVVLVEWGVDRLVLAHADTVAGAWLAVSDVVVSTPRDGCDRARTEVRRLMSALPGVTVVVVPCGGGHCVVAVRGRGIRHRRQGSGADAVERIGLFSYFDVTSGGPGAEPAAGPSSSSLARALSDLGPGDLS
ncbi:MAG: hypothetical protein HOV94_09370 [Saccharothrix sp.]|nr:hypothetical protein [Saccharothrix sp.]